MHPKTKEMVKVLENVKAEKKALIVTAEKDENIIQLRSKSPGNQNSPRYDDERV